MCLVDRYFLELQLTEGGYTELKIYAFAKATAMEAVDCTPIHTNRTTLFYINSLVCTQPPKSVKF